MNRKHILVFILVALVVLPLSIWINTQEGVSIGDERLIRKTDTLYQSTRSTVEWEGDVATMWLRGDVMTASITWQGDAATIAFDDGETVAGQWSAFGLAEPDGMPLAFGNMTVLLDNEQYTLSKVLLANALCRMYLGETEKTGSLWLLVLGMLVYIAGVCTWLWPEETYFLFSRWRYQHAELSYEGILAQRFGAAALMLCGLGLSISPLFF